MKILIATDNYPPRYDGISRFLTEITPALSKEYDVHVLAPDFGPTEDSWPVTKLSVSRIRVGDFHPSSLHFFKIFKIVRKFDVVFLQALGPVGGLALLAAKILRKKIVLYTHSIEWELVPRSLSNQWLWRILPGFIKGLDRIFYRWIHLLIMPSKSVSELYYWNKIDNKRVIINLGVDVDKFKPAKSKSAAKRKVGLEEEVIVVGYHGRLAREKDLRTLMRSFVQLRARNQDKRFHLLIVGDGLREIRQMLERDDVTVTGFQEDVVPFLQAMDLYVMPSLTETSCLSVMEAMSCGLSVVSTPVGYVKDYISDGENGLLFPEKDTIVLLKQLESLLDGRRRSKFGRAARRTMVEKFSWDTTRKEILEVFERL